MEYELRLPMERQVLLTSRQVQYSVLLCATQQAFTVHAEGVRT